ncbi:LamG domain-containing protein [Mycolicibacterium sp. 3033]|nr:LamG domain-containing protein [Mycolicibacterium aurantiacum]
MADAWELVLHHTFGGPPGMIVDHSPTRRSHGQAVNLSEADFTRDGAAPGSGAVRMSPTSIIRIAASPSWTPLGGVRIEIVCETALIRNGGPLVTADSFSFNTGSGYFSGEFNQSHGGSSVATEGGSDPRPLPPDQWVTVALQYDPAGVQVEINCELVNRWDGWNGLLAGTSGLAIGNDLSGHNGLSGLVDDIRIWRLNPDLIGSVFVERPMPVDVGRCWADWSRRLDEFVRVNPHCWERLSALVPRAMFAMMGAIAALPNIRADFADLSNRYQQLWSEGRLGEIPAVLADIIALLRGQGFDPARIADLQALLNDGCLSSVIEGLPLDCDAEFTDMFSVSESF